jgi:putative phosphoesterase
VKIAVLSDIHANIHALQVVLDDISRISPDRVFCLGDLVGYGANPNEVVDLIRVSNIPTIMGNYDEGVAFGLPDCGCVYKDPADRQRGDRSLRWSQKTTSPENKAFMQNLPQQIRSNLDGQHALLVHGSPRKINEYLYEDRPIATFERIVIEAGADLILFGHTHLPYIKTVDRTLLVNTGSVGKPRDGDPRAGYTLVEIDVQMNVEHRRLNYDVAAAARAIRDSDLPDHFADLLESGGL